MSYGQQQGYGYERGHGNGVRRMQTSSLSIFSENGDLFFLVLNGVNQNNVPTSKIRVEGLPQFGNDVQIMFADNITAGIRRKINVADPIDGAAVNMTLKIERGRDGAARLKFSKCREVENAYRPEQGEYVMYYGNPNQLRYDANNYPDNDMRNQPIDNKTPPPPPAPVAMDDRSFSQALSTIKAASFDDTRLSTSKTIFAGNYVTTDQVRAICNVLSFEDNRLNVIKAAYRKIVDQNNIYTLADVFSFNSNKEALNKLIMENQR